jgi:hypothetical protein
MKSVMNLLNRNINETLAIHVFSGIDTVQHKAEELELRHLKGN